MIENYLKKLLACCGLLCCFQLVSANGVETKPANDGIDSISLEADFVRYPFSLNGGEHRLVLANLKTGESYSVFLSGIDLDRCPVQFVTGKQAVLLENNVLQFTAYKPIFEIILRKDDCNRKLELNLSVGCTSCEIEFAGSYPPGIQTNAAYNPVQLVQDVFIGGDCFDVDNGSISFTGHNLARGYFSSGSSSINIEEGVILSTGNIANSAGPNNAYNTGNSFSLNYVDPDLADMVSTNSIYDVASLEFDFTPTTDKVTFEFVFASEEYCEYVNSVFNDVFGFFISGPGFNGPFSNNAENVAIIPNTVDNIAINSVNHLLNSNYYINNIPSWQHPQIPSYLQCENHTTNSGVAIQDIEFDGFTTVMTVSAEVVPCQTYHIKLAIADVSDAYFDSAVFLKANSFNAGENANVSAQVPGGATSGNTAFEDCSDAFFVFERVSDDLSGPLVVHYTYSSTSTAIPGLDFQAFADSVVIPAGDSVYFLAVNVFSDFLIEGVETLVLELEAPCSCNIPFTEMLISDYPELNLELEDFTFCGPASTTLTPTVSGGLGNYTFNWNTNDSLGTIEINPDVTTLYTVTVTDECGNSVEAQSLVEIIEIPSATISGYEQVCPENPAAEILVILGGDGPWDIEYSYNGMPQPPITGITNSPYILSVGALGVYHLNHVFHNGCEGEVQGAASVVATTFQINALANEETCSQAGDGSIDITVSGGQGPYSFEWDGGAGTVEDPVNLAEGTYNLTLTDANGCSATSSVFVPLSADVPVAEAGENATLNCATSELTLNGSGSQGVNFNYLWTTLDGNILSGGTTFFPVINQTGVYFLNITNTSNNCTVADEVEVFIDTVAPIPDIEILGPLALDCANLSTLLDGSNSSPQGILNFEWTTDDGNILPGTENLPNPEVNAAGTYQLTVTNLVNGCSAASFFSIDADFELPEINIAFPMILNCADTIIQLDAGNSSSGAEFEYYWSTGDGNILSGNSTLYPSVDAPGFYTLVIQNITNHCEIADAVEVEQDIEPPIVEAGFVAELDCNTLLAELDGSQSSTGTIYHYNWTTFDGNIVSGGFSLFPTAGAVGTYSLTVLNSQNGCSASDEVVVTENLNVPAGADILALPPECFGDYGSVSILSVSGGEGPYIYSLDGGENFYSTTIFYELAPGVYHFIVQDAEGCQYEEEIIIPHVDEINVTVEPEVEIELGESYQINAYVNIPLSQIDTIFWSPAISLSCTNCLNPVAQPFETTIYTITVFDQNGCESTASILLRVDPIRRVFIPNAFSPNDDGSNDIFLVYADEKSVLKINRLQVFNRWGGKVFEAFDILPNDPDDGWNGVVKGKKMNPAVFVYLAEIEFIDGVRIMYRGDLTILE